MYKSIFYIKFIKNKSHDINSKLNVRVKFFFSKEHIFTVIIVSNDYEHFIVILAINYKYKILLQIQTF